MAKKIKKNELKKVQENNHKQFQIKTALADLVISKRQYDARKAELFANLDEAVQEQQEIQKELQDAYGDVTIDISDGSIMESASTNVEQDDDKGDS